MKKSLFKLVEKARSAWSWILPMGFLFLLPYVANAQVPSCSQFSIGIDSDGQSVIKVSELVSNEPALPLYLVIRSQNFTTVYEGEVTNLDAGINLDLCPYVNQSLVFELKNKDGTCLDTLNVSLPPVPVMKGRKVAVLCSDPLVSPGQLIGDTFPVFQFPCGPKPELKVREDFQEANDCLDLSEKVQQVIYREIEGYDHWGQRFSAIDTIVVYKQPEITPFHIAMDTLYQLYCGENEAFGPQLVFVNPVTKDIDTLSLLKIKSIGNRQVKFVPSQFANLCNLSVNLESTITNNTKCEKQYQVSMEIDQDCFYPDGTSPLDMKPAKGLTMMERGRFRMNFIVVDVDTIAPMISMADKVVTTYTSSRGCEAPLVIPPVSISEKCSGIRRVQASAPGYFTVNLIQNNEGQWVAEDKVMLPKDGKDYQVGDSIIHNAFKVIIESADSCDLTSQDSFYLKVVDDTRPTVSLLKNIRVGLTGQLTWLDVSIMNEGSHDNCGVTLVLGRRTDWATAGDVNLCDGLETDDRINPVEAYYASFRQDILDDSLGCGQWLYDEWMKDSLKYCQGNLPDDLVSQIGGGWTTQIPFTCEDACKDIEVEILVIDNWCNWSFTKSTVKVKDEQPISIVQDLKNTVEMNCSSYNKYYAEVVHRAAALNDRPDTDTARIAAFETLDSLLGGYVSVWQDLDGQMTASDGQNVIPSEHTITIRKEQCENYTKRESVQVIDENSGTFVNELQNVPAIRTVPANERIENGIVSVNCSSSTYEKIFVDIDQCGAGTIRRRFYVAGGCGAEGVGDWLSRNNDRIEFTREQIIYIRPDCELSLGMVEMPPAVSAMDVCQIEKNPNGNYIGELHPDFTGWPDYTWSMECRNLIMGYDDKLFRLFGNNPLGQWRLVRNWHISDQCGGNEGSVVHFEQVIILNELPECDSTTNKPLISGTVVDPGGAPIQDVSIRLLSDVEEEGVAMTSIQGTFSLTGVKDQSYKVFPYKNDQMMRGISTFDLVLMQQDVLGIKRLDNVYKRIAADVNNNGIIEPTDIIELRKGVLRPGFVFSNNTSYQFREAGSKANFAMIEHLKEDMMIDFVGIKIGDVNFSAANATPTSRSSGMKMVLQDQWLQKDVSYRIPVRNDRERDVLGFQFEWDFDTRDVQSISLESGSLQITTEDYAVLDNGKLTASWFDVEEHHFTSDQILFYIIIKTNRRTTLQQTIEPSAEILRTESYVEPGVVQRLDFTFQEIGHAVSHVHIKPNPFREQTVVHWKMDRSVPVDIRIHDVTGRLILHREIDGVKGENEIIFRGSDLPGPGMYYYRISTPDRQWTDKMIFIQ